MTTCIKPVVIENNQNNGLMTKIWGPPMWVALHSISYGYPENPTDEDKQHYKEFFMSLSYVLPCEHCRESYKEIVTDIQKITNEVLANRKTLTKWVYDIHMRVNNKLGVNYGIEYEDVDNRYESYRAKCMKELPGCIIPLDSKAESYKIADKRDCPVIDVGLAKCFQKYAMKRGVDFDLDKYNEMQGDKEQWDERNKECHKIITDMRHNGISQVELEGKYKNLPTLTELTLIGKLSTSMRKKELVKMAKKLGHKFTKQYHINV